jgi:hypothetical protein
MAKWRSDYQRGGAEPTSAQGAEVVHRLGDDFPEEPDDDPPRGLPADLDVEEAFAVHLRLQLHGPLCGRRADDEVGAVAAGRGAGAEAEAERESARGGGGARAAEGEEAVARRREGGGGAHGRPASHGGGGAPASASALAWLIGFDSDWRVLALARRQERLG